MATLGQQHYDNIYDLNQYYVSTNKQLSPMYDKSKKTWSQRLKITKSEKASTQANIAPLSNNQHSVSSSNAGQQQLPPLLPTLQIHQIADYHHGGLEFSPSALSRSMKYAEPWIYGTVRGIPAARPVHFQQQHHHHHHQLHHQLSPHHHLHHHHHHAATLFAAAHPSELAVVLCSCPEYLNGTKRDAKKASICKKCKGSRLPLAPFGGTVRLSSTSTPVHGKFGATTAATLRVVSSSAKSRPTILDPQRDPYDLMRRTRLLSPEPKQQKQSSPSPSTSAVEKGYRANRAKSTSPSRSRSRNRPNPPSAAKTATVSEESAKNATSSKASSLSASSLSSSSSTTHQTLRNHSANLIKDCWLDESPREVTAATNTAPTDTVTADSPHRRSILRCNVNPYDLISSKSLLSSSSLSVVSNGGGQNEFSSPDSNIDYDDDDAVNIDENDVLFSTINHSLSSSSSSSAGNNDGTVTAAVTATTSTSARSRTSSSSVCTGAAATSSKGLAVNYTNVKAIAGQRISFGETTTSSSLITQNGDGFMYESVSPISLDPPTSERNDRRTQNEVIQQSGQKAAAKPQSHLHSHSLADSKKIEEADSADGMTKLVNQPKRPPRRKHDINDTEVVAYPETATPTNISCNRNATNNENRLMSANQGSVGGEGVTVGARSAASQSGVTSIGPANIRSILKRPLSSLSNSSATSSDRDSKFCSGTTGNSTPDVSDVRSETDSYTIRNQNYSQKQQKRNNDSSVGGIVVKSNSTRNNSKGEGSSFSSTRSSTAAGSTGGSQFYIPMPQARKKVQFMVEDRIIQASDDDDDDGDDVEGANDDAYENNDCHSKMATATTTSSGVDGNYSDDTTPTIQRQMGNTSSNYKYYNRKNHGSAGDTEIKPTPVTKAASTATSTKASSSQKHEAPQVGRKSAEESGELLTSAVEMNGKNNATVMKEQQERGREQLRRRRQEAVLEKLQQHSNLVSSAAAVSTTTDYSHSSNTKTKEDELYEDIATRAITRQEELPNSNNMKSNSSATAAPTDTDQCQEVHGSCINHSHNSISKQKDDYKDADLRALTTATVTAATTTTMTLSRNPIRRSNSERHPCYSKQTSARGSIASNNNNSVFDHNNSSSNVILNFKDTMALRMKSARHDSRDLFSDISGGGQNVMLRPREPPPPPPTGGVKQRDSNAAADDIVTTATMTTKYTNPNTTTVPLPQKLAGKIQAIGQISVVGAAAATASKDVVANDDKDYDVRKGDSVFARNGKLSVNGLGKQQQREQHELSAASKNLSSNTSSSTTTTADNKSIAADRISSDCQSAANGLMPVIKHNNGGGILNDVETEAPANIYDSFDSQSNNNKNNNRNASIRGTIASSTLAITTHPCATRDNHDHASINVISGFKDTNANKTNTNFGGEGFDGGDFGGNRLLFGNNRQQTATPPQRTVVRVAPFNKTTSEIHRLKIQHADDAETRHQNLTRIATGGTAMEDADVNFLAQKKTSIIISGDDCYSTTNVSNDTAPLYQSSVVVTDRSSQTSFEGLKVTTSNTVTINVNSSNKNNNNSRTPEQEIIYKNNKINTLLSRHAAATAAGAMTTSTRAIIPICGGSNAIDDSSLNRSASSSSSSSSSSTSSPKRGRTLITLDYEKKDDPVNIPPVMPAPPPPVVVTEAADVFAHEEELVKILRNPVEAVRRNLVPHVCGKNPGMVDTSTTENTSTPRNKPSQIDDKKLNELTVPPASPSPSAALKLERSTFIGKLLEDPTLSHVADGLESEVVVKLIENSLKRLKETRNAIDTSGTKDNDDMNRLINMSLQRIKDERQRAATTDSDDHHSNRGSISSANSFSSANNYEMFDFDANCESDCYQSCSSEITSPGDDGTDASTAATRSKFYQMLVDATLAEIEISTATEDEENEHHYESIRLNGDPIYEEINEIPPPLPLSPPPLNDPELEKKAARSMFEGASKYDILSYLVDAKERGLVREESFEYSMNSPTNPIIIEEESGDKLTDLAKIKHQQQPISQMSSLSSPQSISSESSDLDSSLTSSISPAPPSVLINGIVGGSLALTHHRKAAAADIERNDSGVGSETSKSSRSKYQNPTTAAACLLHKNSPIHLCEDCDGAVEMQVTESGVMFAPLVCRKCGKKRAERKEIITEIVETEEKYGRDLQIILEEFCQPMLVAGLLTQEQLSAIFLNTEELLENNQTLAERMRDGLDIALEQGDDDLLTVNIGKIFLDFTQMLHAFESYCVRQAGASLLLANLEKEKELLRIFLKVSQMENTVLRRMNLNSFLMVPVQRVTKYPLLLARLYKVTPPHLDGRDILKQAQVKIELHLNHINQEAKDVPTKLWRRISSSSPNRRASCEIDMINIKLRKMAIDILEWNHDEVRFAMEGKLLYTQPTDSNWKKARTIKLTPVNALLVTNGKPSANYKAEKVMSDKLNFPKHTGIREASLLVVKEKCGRYTLIREPLYLDRCVVCTEADCEDYFEVQEIASKDTFIFKAEDGVRTKQWYTQLQYHAQGMGAWRKRRNALANIMINGMLSRA